MKLAFFYFMWLAAAFHSAETSNDDGITRQAKLAAVMDKLRAGAYEPEKLPGYAGRDIMSPWNLFKFGLEDMKATFDSAQDEMPVGHEKYIHPLGVVASMRFDADPSAASLGYTGLFEGADSCLARLSLASNPRFAGYIPGAAIKCFRDGEGIASGNLITIFSLSGQGNDTNFFAHEFTNIIGSPTGFGKIIANLIFGRASKCASWVSNKGFAALDQQGQVPKGAADSTPKWPVQIFLVPLVDGAVSSAMEAGMDFRDRLKEIKTGTALWRVEAIDNRQNATEKRHVLGTFTTTSDVLASDYGDRTLFFQHVRGEEDGCVGDSTVGASMVSASGVMMVARGGLKAPCPFHLAGLTSLMNPKDESSFLGNADKKKTKESHNDVKLLVE